MTWTKLGAEYSDDLANLGLSDAAYRTHTEAIGWLYTVERTDLRIPKHLMPRFVGSRRWEEAAKELVARRVWSDDGECYLIHHHEDVIRQSIAAQRKKRTRDKKSQQTYRERQQAEPDNAPPPVSADISADVIADAVSQTDSQTQGEFLESVNGGDYDEADDLFSPARRSA